MPPPPVPKPASPPKSFRRAATLNLFLPGAGLLYLGRYVSGLITALSFVACFIAALILFVVGYAQYLSVAVGGELLQGNRLEEIGEAFHPRWLIGLLILGILIYVLSMILLALARKKPCLSQAQE